MKTKLLIIVPLLIAFSSVFLIGQNVIQVVAGDDQIDDALYTAVAGDTLELITSGGLYHEAFSAVIDIPLTIRAAAGLAEKPVWYCDSASQIIELLDDLTLEGIILDGSLGFAKTAKGIDTDPDNTKLGYELRIDNCDFINFDTGSDGHAIYGNKCNQADTVIITNSYFAHIMQEAIRWKDGKDTPCEIDPGPVKYLSVSYSTFYDIGDEAIYVDDIDNVTATPGPVIIIDHVTVNNAGSKSLYPHTSDGSIIKNTIVANSKTGEYALRMYGANSVLENVLYYNCPSGISKKDGFTYDSGKVLKEQNPYFETDSTFAIAANSPAALFADDGTALGDTNNGTWDAAAITNWELVKNNDWGRLIKNATTDGDTITFVTSGGEYYTPGGISTKEQTLTFMAKPGLAAKPVLTLNYYTSYLLKLHGPSTVKGLIFQGNGMLLHPDSTAGNVTPYLLYWEDEGQHYGKTVIEDCEFYEPRLRAIHTDDNNTFDTLIVNNCYFEEIGETAIYGKEAVRNIDVAIITNNTFYKFGQKGVYLRNVGELEVSHNTFFFSDSTVSGRTSNRGVYAPDDTVVTVRDNIFAKIDEKAVRVYGPSPTVEYNLFWEVGTKVINEDDTLMTFPIFNDEGDPVFKDTSAANLDLALEINTSDAVGTASDGGNLGDPNWGTWELVGVGDEASLPSEYALHQNFPNPFNPSTTIRFDLVEQGRVTLIVYNILGQKLVTLVDQEMTPGHHAVRWSANNLATGVYIYSIKANGFIKNRKMVVVK